MTKTNAQIAAELGRVPCGECDGSGGYPDPLDHETEMRCQSCVVRAEAAERLELLGRVIGDLECSNKLYAKHKVTQEIVWKPCGECPACQLKQIANGV